MHSPKVARYDLEARTHVISKGAFAVDCYEQGDGGLYLARPLVGHPHIAYMEAYLLLALGLQVNRWEHHPGSAYGWLVRLLRRCDGLRGRREVLDEP